jgi:hypothetical protein
MADGLGRYSPIGVLADVLLINHGDGKWVNLDNEYWRTELLDHTTERGWAWKYRPTITNYNEETKEFEEFTGVVRNVYYTVYLPSKQWFWPSITEKIQDTIYSWTDSGGLQHEDVADMLEDGLYHERFENVN